MRKVTLILFINFLLFPLFGIAQDANEAEKRAIEREIKTSGDYLYGEAVANTKDEAVKAAKSVLVSEINKEILNNHEWQFAKSIQAKDVEYDTDMIDLMRGNKFRVIAYIKKDNLEVVFHDKSPEIKLSDKKETKASKKKEEKEVKETVAVAEAPAVKEETVSVAEIAPAEEIVVIEEAIPVSETIVATVTEEVPSNVVETAVPVAMESAVLEKEYYYKGDDLLGKIVKAPSAREVNKILADNKKNGKAMYGNMESLMNPENAYIIVYKRTGEIVAILDKGSHSSRRDLISGEMKNKDIYTGNQVTWFQIY